MNLACKWCMQSNLALVGCLCPAPEAKSSGRPALEGKLSYLCRDSPRCLLSVYFSVISLIMKQVFSCCGGCQNCCESCYFPLPGIKGLMCLEIMRGEAWTLNSFPLFGNANIGGNIRRMGIQKWLVNYCNKSMLMFIYHLHLKCKHEGKTNSRFSQEFAWTSVHSSLTGQLEIWHKITSVQNNSHAAVSYDVCVCALFFTTIKLVIINCWKKL